MDASNNSEQSRAVLKVPAMQIAIKRQSDQGNALRRRAALTPGATIEDGYSETAFLAGKPFGNCLAGAGPVEAFPDSKEKSEGCEGGDR